MGEMKRETGELGMAHAIGWSKRQTLHRTLWPMGSPKRLTACGRWVWPLDQLLKDTGMTHPWLPLTHACGSCFRGMRAYTSGVISENMVTFYTYEIGLLDGI